MALETKCQTPGLEMRSVIGKRIVSFTVKMPFRMDLDEEEATLLEKNIHNAVEMVF